MHEQIESPVGVIPARTPSRGRPRSDRAHRAILEAARELLIENGYAALRLEHVAARAGVGKATIYRRWGSKQALALEMLMELVAPHIAVPDVGDTRAELRTVVMNVVHALSATPFGPTLQALLSEVALDPLVRDPFREKAVQARRDQIAGVIERGIARGDLRRDLDATVATELLVGPVYFRLVFGGRIDAALADAIVEQVLRGFAAPARRGVSGR